MSLKLNERYPGRFDNPSADYPQGSFKNRTTPTSKDGSYLEKDWANDKEGFFQSLLSAAGITANGAVDAVGASQFFDALQALKQIQAGIAFTTAGSAGALTLAPVPAITAYVAPQRFRLKFNQASIGNDTLNVSGQGAKSIKQYDSTGAKVAAVFAANQLADVEYDGTDMVLIDALPADGSVPGDVKLAAYATPDAGWLKTNGAAISRTTYAALFAKIGTTFGVGDGSTTFNVPDTRANFVRGWADNSTVDAGRVFGSYQNGTIVCVGDATITSSLVASFFNSVDDSLPNHVARLGGDGVPAALTGVRSTTVTATGSSAGLETAMYTRPRNIALSYFIKF